MTKVQVKEILFTSKLVVYQMLMYLILLYFCEEYDLETILTSNYNTNIQDGIVKGFGSIE